MQRRRLAPLPAAVALTVSACGPSVPSSSPANQFFAAWWPGPVGQFRVEGYSPSGELVAEVQG